MNARVFPLLALVTLGGCAIAEPHYKRPALPTPNEWPQGQPYDAATHVEGATALPPWRDFYADERLRTLIDQALTQSRDLRVVALNIERARAQYHVQRAQRLPQVDAVASGDLQGVGEPPNDVVDRQYSAGVAVTAFELDLFGRIRGLNRAALQRYFATRDARDSVQISLISEVAAAYFTYAGDLELLRLAQSTLASQQQSLDLTQQRFDAGASSQLDVARARTTVESARADVARFSAQAAQDENALTLLVGAPIPPELRPTSIDAIAFGVDNLPPGLPSDVLLNRPDIRESEHLLRAANADVGAARAAFFPSISISGFDGATDPRFENLFDSATRAWTFTPQVSVPLFHGGALLGGLGVANADRRIAVAQYEQSIQAAFREVADALAARGAIGDELAAREALVQADQESFRLSQARFDEGVDDYLSLLDAQRQLYAAQQNLVTARVARATNFITLYKTLGGGA